VEKYREIKDRAREKDIESVRERTIHKENDKHRERKTYRVRGSKQYIKKKTNREREKERR